VCTPLSKAHALRGLKNPVEDSAVKDLMAMTARAYAKRGVQPNKKDALTRDPLQALLATCDKSLRGKRDRALLLFAWFSGGRRRSEVSAADLRFLTRVGPHEYSYELAHSKTNQSGADRAENHKPIAGVAAQALEDWLQASGIQDGALFRRIMRGGHVGDRVSAAAVRDIVRTRAARRRHVGPDGAERLRASPDQQCTGHRRACAHLPDRAEGCRDKPLLLATVSAARRRRRLVDRLRRG